MSELYLPISHVKHKQLFKTQTYLSSELLVSDSRLLSTWPLQFFEFCFAPFFQLINLERLFVILEQVAYHLSQFVSLHKRYKVLQERQTANGQALTKPEAAALVAGELGCVEHALLELFAHFGPEVEEFLHQVKDYDYSAAHFQHFLLRTRPALPVSLRFSWKGYVPGTAHADGDLRAEMLFSGKIYVMQEAIEKNLAAAEILLPESAERLAAIAAERAAVRRRGLQTFLAAAGTDWCPGLSSII